MEGDEAWPPGIIYPRLCPLYGVPDDSHEMRQQAGRLTLADQRPTGRGGERGNPLLGAWGRPIRARRRIPPLFLIVFHLTATNRCESKRQPLAGKVPGKRGSPGIGLPGSRSRIRPKPPAANKASPASPDPLRRPLFAACVFFDARTPPRRLLRLATGRPLFFLFFSQLLRTASAPRCRALANGQPRMQHACPVGQDGKAAFTNRLGFRYLVYESDWGNTAACAVIRRAVRRRSHPSQPSQCGTHWPMHSPIQSQLARTGILLALSNSLEMNPFALAFALAFALRPRTDGQTPRQPGS